MTKGLQQYFPMIRTRQEVLKEIQSQKHLTAAFRNWTDEQQDEFLNFCTGVKGVKLLYDAFFKEIMNPETTPERLEQLLSFILNQPVRIKSVLPNDSNRIADESSLLILDILIELEDGSLANVEVQKLGYLFPGQRSACYSADLLLRQYKRIKGEQKKKFSYKSIKNVYTIVLFEKSPAEFQLFTHDYIHRLEQVSDTGIKINLLQKYIFIPLDIFQKSLHNNGIQNELEAWLTFFSTDEPEWIEQLITTYPAFIPLYQDVYSICQNTERVMEMYSEELRILDKNTVQLMIDEMQDTINEQKAQLDQKDEQLDRQTEQLHQQTEQLHQQTEQLHQQTEQIHQQTEQLYHQTEQISQKEAVIHEKDQEIERLKKLLASKEG